MSIFGWSVSMHVPLNLLGEGGGDGGEKGVGVSSTTRHNQGLPSLFY